MRLFGFEITAKREERNENPSFVSPPSDDGAVTVASGGSFGTMVDLDGTIRSEAELVSKYRDMAGYPDVDMAIDEIVNEAICVGEEDDVVKIRLDDLDMLSDNAKKAIEDEFTQTLKMLSFNRNGHDLFRKWYVDGRLYFHVIVDDQDLLSGIQELRFIDPRKIRKVREITRKPINGQKNQQVAGTDVTMPEVVNEYFVFNEKGFGGQSVAGQQRSNMPATGLKIAVDSILHVVSGVTDSSATTVLGYLHKAIKPLNQLKTLEDATVVYRLVRAPERRVWKIDVGNLPKMKAEQYLRDTMVQYKNRLVYDSTSGEVRDDRRYLCFGLDTKIPLLDGRTLTLKNMIEEYQEGKVNWVYSCNSENGEFVPGPVSWAGVTKHNTKVVKVTLDNGKSVICTPDHKFPVWNKGLMEAKDLLPGESLIPGYRRMKAIMKNGIEYEQIYKNDTKKWEYTHREVSAWKNKNGLREEFEFSPSYSNKNKNTIHHKDFNSYNNNPDNLVMMNAEDHIKYCRERNINRVGIKTQSGSYGYHAEQLHNHKVVSVEWLDEKIDVGCISVDANETYHSFHTYLLDIGVYTKNTMLEDIWLPTRGDGRGTSIDTLPAGELTGVLDDVLYFQKKLFNSLNVPVARLNSDNIFTAGRATEITRDEVKFSKFIYKLRVKFCDLFLQILEKQLILKNKISYDDWKQIKQLIKFDFLKDNEFAELRDLDLMNDRLNILALLDQWGGKYFSHEWIRKNILKQTDDDIKKIDEQIVDEADNAQLHPELLAPQMGMDMQPTTGPTNEPIPQPGPLMQPPDSNLPGGPASIGFDKPLMGNGGGSEVGGKQGSGKGSISSNKKSGLSGK